MRRGIFIAAAVAGLGATGLASLPLEHLVVPGDEMPARRAAKGRSAVKQARKHAVMTRKKRRK